MDEADMSDQRIEESISVRGYEISSPDPLTIYIQWI
jgi:hypothetical protein